MKIESVDQTTQKKVSVVNQVWVNTGMYINNSEGRSKILPKIYGYGHRKRAMNFAQYYGHDYTKREEVAEEKTVRIKPEVLLCIARADSHLGRALKSKNNVGNVGNNDRGDVVHYATLEEGIRAMGSRALNGTHLRHKQSIGSLSPGGGGNPPYYATSETTRNANVLNCLTLIYNKKISPEFKFRM